MDSEEARRIRMVYAAREQASRPDLANPGRQRLIVERNEALGRVLDERFRRPLGHCRVLDVGCGYGSLLSWFQQRGICSENLYGVDLLPNRIEVARETYPEFTFVEGNAEELAFPDQWFDLVLLCTVFSSILDPAMARSVARTVSRVLANHGAVVWYDIRYPNPFNPNVRAMTKSRIRELFPRFDLQLRSLSLLPLVAYRLGRLTVRTYPLLQSVPILRSHYVGLLQPAGGAVASKIAPLGARVRQEHHHA